MKALTTEQVEAVLVEARKSSTRDWCVFLLTFRHALRSEEARRLRLSDIDMQTGSISIGRVKGSLNGVQSLDRHRGKPILDEVLALKTWLRERVGTVLKYCFLPRKAGSSPVCNSFACFVNTQSLAASHPTWRTPTSCGTPFAPRWRLNMPTCTKYRNEPATEHLEHDDLYSRVR